MSSREQNGAREQNSAAFSVAAKYSLRYTYLNGKPLTATWRVKFLSVSVNFKCYCLQPLYVLIWYDAERKGPWLQQNLTNQNVNSSSTLTLACYAQGVPPPFITWYKNGALVEAAPGKYMELFHIPPRVSFSISTGRCLPSVRVTTFSYEWGSVIVFIKLSCTAVLREPQMEQKQRSHVDAGHRFGGRREPRLFRSNDEALLCPRHHPD